MKLQRYVNDNTELKNFLAIEVKKIRTQIVYLKLKGFFDCIPKAINSFKNLSNLKIELAIDSIVSWPDNLPALEIIKLQHTTYIPADIAANQRLHEVKITQFNGPNAYLVASINYLRYVQILELSFLSGCKRLPDLSNLIYLKKLVLRELPLGILPNSFNRLKNLEIAVFINFPINRLPKLKGLDRLRELTLFLPRLNFLSSSIKYLTALKYLSIMGSNIIALPREIGHCNQLETLVLSNSFGNDLPLELGKVPLKSLNGYNLATKNYPSSCICWKNFKSSDETQSKWHGLNLNPTGGYYSACRQGFEVYEIAMPLISLMRIFAQHYRTVYRQTSVPLQLPIHKKLSTREKQRRREAAVLLNNLAGVFYACHKLILQYCENSSNEVFLDNLLFRLKNTESIFTGKKRKICTNIYTLFTVVMTGENFKPPVPVNRGLNRKSQARLQVIRQLKKASR